MMMMNELEFGLIEAVLTAGLSIIAYFLKLIHADLRHAIKQLQQQETKLALGSRTFDELERRIETMSEDRERRLTKLEDAVFQKGA